MSSQRIKKCTLNFFIFLFATGCTTDREAIQEFNSCLTQAQREALDEMERVCDRFIQFNYPDKDLETGYRQFLKDMETYQEKRDNEIWRTNDSIQVMKVNQALKAAFGEGYEDDAAIFNLLSSRTICLEQTSNQRFVDYFIEDSKKSGGGDGPHIIGSRMIINKVDPIAGQTKVIYLTEVVYRILFFLTVK